MRMKVSSQDDAAHGVKRPDLKAVEAPVRLRPASKPAAKPRKPRKPAVRRAAVPPPDARMIARPKVRHYLGLASFVLVVLAPLVATVWYLYARAADQYHSEVAFSIRSEEPGGAAAGLLGAITQIGATGTASNTDILYEYIRSQQIVEAIAAKLDLRAIYNRAEGDPVFTLGDTPTIEALLAHWRRTVQVDYELATGIIHVRANAFTPEDAHAITTAILDESSDLVNTLSEQAREDGIRYAREDLAEAERHLHSLRQRLAEFRRENRIVDPSADVAGQMGLLNAMQTELAQALVERDMLLTYADEKDQRVVQAGRRIDAITKRIDDERRRLGTGGAGTPRLEGSEEPLPDIIGSYEEQLVDLEFANAAYTQAMANLGAAKAEARRQSLYLAAHVEPTVAESALYPRRLLLAGLTGLFLMLGWSILMLVYYNVRDSR